MTGSPTLALNDGGTASFTGDSGIGALTFIYTVSAGQNTPDLTVTSLSPQWRDHSGCGFEQRECGWRRQLQSHRHLADRYDGSDNRDQHDREQQCHYEQHRHFGLSDQRHDGRGGEWPDSHHRDAQQRTVGGGHLHHDRSEQCLVGERNLDASRRSRGRQLHGHGQCLRPRGQCGAASPPSAYGRGGQIERGADPDNREHRVERERRRFGAARDHGKRPSIPTTGFR